MAIVFTSRAFKAPLAFPSPFISSSLKVDQINLKTKLDYLQCSLSSEFLWSGVVLFQSKIKKVSFFFLKKKGTTESINHFSRFLANLIEKKFIIERNLPFFFFPKRLSSQKSSRPLDISIEENDKPK